MLDTITRDALPPRAAALSPSMLNRPADLTIRDTAVAMVRSNSPDLSMRQLGMLLLLTRGKGVHTVRGMAAALKVSKPAITRATNRLIELGFAARKADPADKRSVLLTSTQDGHQHVRLWAEALNAAPPAA